jgi:hypothetical protein
LQSKRKIISNGTNPCNFSGTSVQTGTADSGFKGGNTRRKQRTDDSG